MDFNPATPIPQRVTRARARGVTHPPPMVPPLKLNAIKRAMEEDMASEQRRPGRKRKSLYGAGGSAPIGRADESSLYFIVMNSKVSLQVTIYE